MVQTFTGDLDAFKTLIGGDKTVYIDFYADWCGPCKMIGPYFEELAQAAASDDSKVFIKVNVDESEAVAAFCQISAMPTFKVYKGGEMVGELVGANKDKLKEMTSKAY